MSIFICLTYLFIIFLILPLLLLYPPLFFLHLYNFDSSSQSSFPTSISSLSSPSPTSPSTSFPSSPSPPLSQNQIRAPHTSPDNFLTPIKKPSLQDYVSTNVLSTSSDSSAISSLTHFCSPVQFHQLPFTSLAHSQALLSFHEPHSYKQASLDPLWV